MQLFSDHSFEGPVALPSAAALLGTVTEEVRIICLAWDPAVVWQLRTVARCSGEEDTEHWAADLGLEFLLHAPAPWHQHYRHRSWRQTPALATSHHLISGPHNLNVCNLCNYEFFHIN